MTCIVFEKYASAGGLLRYGIPDFKMEKRHVERRVAQMEAEGVTFHYGAHVGVNLPVEARSPRASTPWCWPAAPNSPRDLPIPGRDLDGVHFAMDYPAAAEPPRRAASRRANAADLGGAASTSS